MCCVELHFFSALEILKIELDLKHDSRVNANGVDKIDS